MGLFSFLSKNKQEAATGDSEFYSRAEEESNTVRGRSKRKQSNRANEPVDPVLPEKKRARRRLVGAIALVLAAIIGLPMILDSEQKPLADDIAIQIPSKDKPFLSDNKRQAAPAPSTPAGGKLPASAGLDKNEEVIELPVAPAVSEKTNSLPPPALNASGKPDAQIEQKKSNQAEPKAAVPQPAEKAKEATRAQAILEGKPDVKPEKTKASTEIKSGKFVIQVAALASQEKVTELQGTLKNAGIKSYTQKVATQSGERIRVRVGPFGSKEEADKMRAKLGKLGLNGTLVPA